MEERPNIGWSFLSMSVIDKYAHIAVVIPAYKNRMSDYERISFERCVGILHPYPRILIVPHALSVDAYVELDPSILIVRCDECHFHSLTSYSRFCTSSKFYSLFSKYEYILIYQLDSYVFRDALLEWCGNAYDYIGAPWLNYEFQISSRKRWTQSRLLRPFLRQVGNGGFSLRRVKTFRHAAFWLWPLSVLLRDIPEDVFWTHIGARLWPGFQIPGVDKALQFAWDMAPGQCFMRNHGELPFGAHAWNTHGLEFWKDKIVELAGKS